MNIVMLIKGFFIGLFAAIPTGPMGIICIRRTLSQGRIYGITFGLGVATADLIYGTLAIFGVSFISNFLSEYRLYIQLFSGIFLIILGTKISLQENLPQNKSFQKKTNLVTDFTSSLLFTLTNPLTIILFASIFSWPMLKIDINEISVPSSFLLVLGIFLGSAIWFSILSFLVNFLRYRFSTNYIKWFNKLSGILIIIIGILALLKILIFH